MKVALIFAIGLFASSFAAAEQIVDVQVTSKGFEPPRIEVKPNEKVTLNITRKVDVTCAKKVAIPSLGIEKDLPLNKTVAVELKSLERGEIAFGCAMKQMLGGVIVVN